MAARHALVLLSLILDGVTAFSRKIFCHPADEFAAREARRYIYLATGNLADLIVSQTNMTDQVTDWLRKSSHEEVVVLANAETALMKMASLKLPRLGESEHVVHQINLHGGTLTLLVGKDPISRMYAVYSLAESLGVRFSLHGDTLPDPTAAGGLPLAAHAHTSLPVLLPTSSSKGAPEQQQHVRVHTPMFAVRGIQPFHDFPEGPDWWDVEMYQHVVTQLAKMKMKYA